MFVLTEGILLLSVNGGLLSNNLRLRVLIGMTSIASSNILSLISGVPVKSYLLNLNREKTK